MKYVFYIICLIGLVSCKKDLQFSISGLAYDDSFHQALVNSHITLKQINVDGSEASGYISDMITSDGKFEIEFKREKALKYILTIEKENYFTYQEEINFSDLSSEYPLFKYCKVYAKSWIKFHFKNNFPANTNDVFTLSYLDPLKTCDECCEKDKYYFNGIIDTSFYCLFEGGKSFNFNYITSSPFSQVDFSVLTAPLDTVEFYKEY